MCDANVIDQLLGFGIRKLCSEARFCTNSGWCVKCDGLCARMLKGSHPAWQLSGTKNDALGNWAANGWTIIPHSQSSGTLSRLELNQANLVPGNRFTGGLHGATTRADFAQSENL